MDVCDWQCQISHSAKSFTPVYLISLYFLTLFSLTAFLWKKCRCYTLSLSTECQMSPLWHNEVHCHNRLFALFYGSVRVGVRWGGGWSMLLSCWRNVIRPRPTVNIHIPGPQRNTRQAALPSRPKRPVSFASAGEQKPSQLDANREEWGGFTSEPRRWRNREPLKREGEKGADGSGPITLFLVIPYSCSHGSQPLCAAPLRGIIWIQICLYFFIMHQFCPILHQHLMKKNLEQCIKDICRTFVAAYRL